MPGKLYSITSANVDRVIIPFSADIEQRCIDKPKGAAWGWFDHPQYGKVEWLYCPICNNSAGVLTRHTISENGEVNASIMCNKGTDCLWHIWGTLDKHKENGGVARKPFIT